MGDEFIRLPDEDVAVNVRREKIKHLLIGSPAVVRRTIQVLHTKGYAESGFWSKPVTAGGLGNSEGDVLCILIKHVLME